MRRWRINAAFVLLAATRLFLATFAARRLHQIAKGFQRPNILTVGKCPATLRDQGSVRTDRADRRTNRFSANENAVTSRHHTPRCFASFRVAAKRLVVDALLNLEGADWFGGVGGFVNVSRHRDNLLVNGLGAFLFGKRKILHRRITLGNERLISAESDRMR